MFASRLLELIKLSGCVRREGSYLLIAEAVVAGVAGLDGISKRQAGEIKALLRRQKVRELSLRIHSVTYYRLGALKHICRLMTKATIVSD